MGNAHTLAYGLKKDPQDPYLVGLGDSTRLQHIHAVPVPDLVTKLSARSATTDYRWSGLFTAIPYSAAVVLCMVIGKLSDQYRKNGGGATSGKRRNVIALTMIIASCILLIPFVNNIALLVLIFSLTLAGIASTKSLNFSLLNDMLPSSGELGRAMAFVVVGGNVFGMLAPVVTGYVGTA